MSYHGGFDVFSLHNHKSFTTRPTSSGGGGGTPMGTMNEDMKILIEEHNKSIKLYQLELETLQSRITKLETLILNLPSEKKEQSQKIDGLISLIKSEIDLQSPKVIVRKPPTKKSLN